MGSVPEVIENGVTGMLVDSIDDAVHAVGRLPAMDRQAIRRRFEERFAATRMARDYVAAYNQLIDEGSGSYQHGTAIDIRREASPLAV
jgi:glycosyltransferase involved in cell wall biosynthesis